MKIQVQRNSQDQPRSIQSEKQFSLWIETKVFEKDIILSFVKIKVLFRWILGAFRDRQM